MPQRRNEESDIPQHRNRFAKNAPIEPGDNWVHPLLGEWTSWMRAARRTPGTIKLRSPVVQKFAEEVRVDPVSACQEHIIEWFESHPEWAPATAKSYWSALSSWFKWLNLQGHRVDNPMLKLESPKVPENTPRPVSDADLRRMLGVRMHHSTRVKILLAALAGLRCSEIARVRGEDVDLSAGLLYVRGKGGAVKTVPLHPMLVTESSRMPRSGFWFPGRLDGGGVSKAPVTGNAVSRSISEVMMRAGVRGTPHALRHWFGTNALRMSGDLRLVQLLMRHASVRSTQIYTEVADDRRAGVVEMLDFFDGD